MEENYKSCSIHQHAPIFCINLPYSDGFGRRTASVALRLHCDCEPGSVASHPDECELPAT